MGQRSNGRGKAKRKMWGAFEKKWVREATDGGKPRGRFGERLKKMGQRSNGRGKAKRKIWGAIEKKWVREATDGGKPRGRFGERLKKKMVRGRFGERLDKNWSEKQRTGESQEEDLGSV